MPEDTAVQVRRFDRSSIIRASRNDDGSISGEAIATRAGIFRYRLPDGTTRAEFRPPEEVFKADSMASAKMRPITDGHPDEFVSLDNAKDFAVGFTGENIRRDGLHMVVPVKVNTSEGIAAVDGGRRQLSFGYTCVVDEKSGSFGGEEYTHAQRDIAYNHLALCENARAGNSATLRLDAADAIMEVEDTGKESERMAVKVRLDSTGIEYDVPQEVKAELDRTVLERNDARTKLDTVTAERDTMMAERDAAKAKIGELEKVDTADVIRKGVAERIAIEGKARKVLDEEASKKLDSMTVPEIQAAVIGAKFPDLDLADKSEPYITCRFDMITESAGDGDSSAAQKNADTVIGDTSKERRDATAKTEKVREDAIEAMRVRSRGEEVTAK